MEQLYYKANIINTSQSIINSKLIRIILKRSLNLYKRQKTSIQMNHKLTQIKRLCISIMAKQTEILVQREKTALKCNIFISQNQLTLILKMFFLHQIRIWQKSVEFQNKENQQLVKLLSILNNYKGRKPIIFNFFKRLNNLEQLRLIKIFQKKESKNPQPQNSLQNKTLAQIYMNIF